MQPQFVMGWILEIFFFFFFFPACSESIGLRPLRHRAHGMLSPDEVVQEWFVVVEVGLLACWLMEGPGAKLAMPRGWLRVLALPTVPSGRYH